MIILTPLLDWLKHIPPELGTALLSMVPLAEIQVSVPFALTVYGMSTARALVFAFLGNILVIPLVRVLFKPFFLFVEQHWSALHRFIDRHVHTLETTYQDNYSRYGAIFLFLFVAIPIPGSGVWTASILSVIFSIKARHAVPTIIVGQLVALALIMLVTKGGMAFFT